jgi:hypothetical protein
MKKTPKVILLKGNGPISINDELMELFTITTSHGLIGLPLKSLRADKVIYVKDYETFLTVEKTIKDKPCCFVYSYETLDDEDMGLIKTIDISTL